MNRAVYPGSFDPITNGHIDILERALKVFDEVIVLIAVNPNKESRFSVEDRIQMIKEATKNMKGVKVDFTSGLTVDYAHKVNSKHLVRGLRTVTDFKYEYNLADEYHKIDPNIDLVFFMADEKLCNISSSSVDELIKHKKDISKFVPESVLKMYKKK
ncbi:MAG: pantetheine-phosphate adenylyltransferase [Firmicutes bacterium]|nr:pantetheine-phosphate adenylyltransferase [Candidatus Fiminaster equi]